MHLLRDFTPCTQRAPPCQHRGRLPPPLPRFPHAPAAWAFREASTQTPYSVSFLPHQEEVLFRAGSSFRLSARLGWERERGEQEALPSWFARCVSPSTYTVGLALSPLGHLQHLPRGMELGLKLSLFPGGSSGKGDVPRLCAGSRMNLVSMATDSELKWITLWVRVRWAAVLVLLLGSLVMLLLPLAAVEDQCHAVLKGLSFLKSKLGAGSSGVTRYTGQTTGLSVTSKGLELLVLKGKASPEVKLEAKAALNQALEMKRQGKREKAHKLFVYALKMDPDYVDALNEFGIFSEEEKDILQADYLYSKALTISPCNEKALINRDRTLPLVEEIDQRYFSIIDSKVKKVMAIPKGNSALRRVMEESYYHHIYHTVAIEGNTLTLSEIRHIIETRYAVPGKSLVEQNEVIGMHAALKYVNTTLVSRIGSVTISDILEIHRRVLGYADPVEAGRFRTTQVFVGHHIPPHPQDVEKQMQEFVQWMNSEDAMSLHPVEFAALAHYKLVYIHPFVDGNGRTSRLLMNLILMQAGYPPITIRKEQRAEYYHVLEVANEGDVRPFIRFIAKCTETTLDMLLIATTEYSVGLPEADGSAAGCKQTIPVKT